MWEIFVWIIVGIFILMGIYLLIRMPTDKTPRRQMPTQTEAATEDSRSKSKSKKKKGGKQPIKKSTPHTATTKSKGKSKIKKSLPTHPLFLLSLPGFSSAVVDFAVQYDNEDIFIMAAERSVIRVFYLQEPTQNGIRSRYTKIEYGEISAIDMNQKYVSVSLGTEREVKYFGLTPSTLTLHPLISIRPPVTHITPITCLRTSGLGSGFLSMTSDNETNVIYWTYEEGPRWQGEFNTNTLGNKQMVGQNDRGLIGFVCKSDEFQIYTAGKMDSIVSRKQGSILGKVFSLRGHKKELSGGSISQCGNYVLVVAIDQVANIYKLPPPNMTTTKSPLLLKEFQVAHGYLSTKMDIIRVLHRQHPQHSKLVIAFDSATDIILIVFDQTTMEQIGKEEILKGHTSDITHLKFVILREQVYLLSSGEDGYMYMWMVPHMYDHNDYNISYIYIHK